MKTLERSEEREKKPLASLLCQQYSGVRCAHHSRNKWRDVASSETQNQVLIVSKGIEQAKSTVNAITKPAQGHDKIVTPLQHLTTRTHNRQLSSLIDLEPLLLIGSDKLA